jgi:hypothetical protein
MCVLIFSTIFVWNISHSTKKWARYDVKNVYWYSCKVPIIVRTWMKLEVSWQIFKKYSNIKYHKNPPSGSQVVPCGQTDMTLISAFHISLNKPKHWEFWDSATLAIAKDISCQCLINYATVQSKHSPHGICGKQNRTLSTSVSPANYYCTSVPHSCSFNYCWPYRVYILTVLLQKPQKRKLKNTQIHCFPFKRAKQKFHTISDAGRKDTQ